MTKFKPPSWPERFQRDHDLITPLYSWPALSPAQAFLNEWLVAASTKLRGKSILSISIKVKLTNLSAMPAPQREAYMEQVLSSLPTSDPFHPSNLDLCSLEIGNGASFYGTRSDLTRVAAETGLPPQGIEPLWQPERPRSEFERAA